VSVTAVRRAPQVVSIACVSRVCADERTEGFDCEYSYTVYGSGDVIVDTHVVPSRTLPFLPRIGVQMTILGQFNTFTWYGRGPHETYADRKASGAVGLYSGSVDEQYFPYIMPQENGNKTDVRWAALSDQNNLGLLVVGMPLMNVSAHHYTTEDLARAQHTCELKRRDNITLHLDERQSGLGGASCGPGTLAQYLIQPEETRWSLRLRPFAGLPALAMSLSKQALEKV
jgi:hypothetical protein